MTTADSPAEWGEGIKTGWEDVSIKWDCSPIEWEAPPNEWDSQGGNAS